MHLRLLLHIAEACVYAVSFRSVVPADLAIVQQRQHGVRQTADILNKVVFHQEFPQLKVCHGVLCYDAAVRAVGKVDEPGEFDGCGALSDFLSHQSLERRHVLYGGELRELLR